MRTISTADELAQWRSDLQGAADAEKRCITICGGTGCTALGSPQVYDAFATEIKARGLTETVGLKRTGCHGFCERGPVVVILPEKFFYPSVKPEDVPEILDRTVLNGEVIERLLYVDPATGEQIVHDPEVPFYAAQTRLVFQHNGELDPIDLADYVLRDGYAAAAKALTAMTPDEVVQEVLDAGLRGRGGAGFPTGLKWRFCRESEGQPKYLICNADEGDPGAFMDRSLLEGTPHAILEGMIVAAYAIGAQHGIIYVRAEYPLAVENTMIALGDARAAGLLGDNILGTDTSFDIEIRQGAGAFVCGEETALIASLEGGRGMPRPRPPFPATHGYLGKPTNINNVETLANVPLIILNGAEWYSSVGTEGTKGTKIFALAGKVRNTGLVEVPMGATLRQIVFDIGGGVPPGREFKAAQMGGPSGGCVPAQFLDMPIDYDSVKEIGAIMGSGGLIIMDDNTCMVDMARFFMEFVQAESCGKCVPCRLGTKKMLDIVTRITEGRGKPEDLDELERIAKVVKVSSLCGLGQTAPNPVLSTLRYFRDEYEEHIYLKHCRAGVCEGLVWAPCEHACPAGVNVPEYVASIAEGKLEQAVDIIRRRNPFVSVCGRVCDHPCEQRCRRSELDQPLAIRALKRYAVDNAEAVGEPLAPPVDGEAEVAIVGGGPAGLTCAYFLALMGRKSVVFEEQPIPGGMLALGIPEYRLPKDVLQRDVDFVLAHGVELRTGVRVESIEELRQQYKAVFVGSGAQKARSLGIEGEDLEGVVDSLEFLRERGLGREPWCGKSVVVIGGGNVAVDAARSALRLGAEKVTIAYRRTREEMPAYEEEIEEAIEEGVELELLTAPARILGEAGKVTGIELARMELGEAEQDGRRRPEPVEGSEFVVECDMVLPAIGQVSSVETLEVEDGPDLERGRVKIDPRTGATSVANVFSGGDCVSGGGSAIEAIGAGQKAALAIDEMLGGSGELPDDRGFTSYQTPEEELDAAPPRAQEPLLPVGERLDGFCEVALCLDCEAATAEARRCLRCDLEED